MSVRFGLVLLLLLLPSLVLLSSLTSPVPAIVCKTCVPSGVLFRQIWGGSKDDVGQGVAVDASGNIYVAGVSPSFTPDLSLTLLKYNPGGSLLWERIWKGSFVVPLSVDYGNGVAVDAFGNVYVTGYTNSTRSGGLGVLLLKFDSTGTLLWQKTWGGNNNDYHYVLSDYGNALAVDISGNIYVTGQSNSYGNSGESLFLLKFNSTGSLLWQKAWDGYGGYDVGFGVAVDTSSHVYVTGVTNSFGAGLSDVLLLKYNSTDGSLLWQKTWGGTNSDVGQGVAVDASGNIYVTGLTSSFGAGDADVLLLKFDPAGTLLWQETWGGSNKDWGLGIALGASGNLYVTGLTKSFGAGGLDVLLLRFGTDGALFDVETWGGSGDDYGNGVAIDSTGNALVTGTVSEAPPYPLASQSGTLDTPAFSLGSPSGLVGTPTFPVDTLSGAAQRSAGIESYAGGRDEFLLKYGVLPAVSFLTNPTAGGLISFNGTTYFNGQKGYYSGIFSISAHPPVGYTFSSWSSTGGINISGMSQNETFATVNGSGTLTANFTKTNSTSIYPAGLLLAALITTVSMTLVRRRRG